MKKLLYSGLLLALVGNAAASEVISQVVLKAGLVGENQFIAGGAVSLVASAQNFVAAIKAGDISAAQDQLQCLNGLLFGDAGVVVKHRQQIIKGWFKNQVKQTDYVISHGLGFNAASVESTLEALGLAPYEDFLKITLDSKTAYLKAYLAAMANSLARAEVQMPYIQAFHRVYGQNFSLLLTGTSMEDLISRTQLQASDEAVDLDQPDEDFEATSGWKTALMAAPVIAVLALIVKRNL